MLRLLRVYFSISKYIKMIISAAAANRNAPVPLLFFFLPLCSCTGLSRPHTGQKESSSSYSYPQ